MAAKTLKEMMADKKRAIADATGKRSTAVKPKVGKTRYRILPSWRGVGEPQFWHDFGQHFIKDAKGDLKAVYVCVEKTFDRRCAICEALRDGIINAVTDDDKKLLKESTSSSRIFVNALVETDMGTPVVLELTQTTFDKIIDIYQENVDDDNEDFNIVTDQIAGVDIIITRSGTGLTTEYSVQPALKGSKPVSNGVLAKLINLDEYVAQEHTLALEKARDAARAVIESTQKMLPKSNVSADDEAFDDDVGYFEASTDEEPIPTPKAKPKKDEDAEDAEFTEVKRGKETPSSDEMTVEELDALLGGIDD